MYFDSLSSLIDMDGHGAYVWAVYGIGLLVILYNIGVPLLRQKQVIRSIQCHGRRTKKAITTLGRSVQPARSNPDGRGSGSEKAVDSMTDRGEVI
ncbi:heme exporter protein CcmD [Endozoicomonas euniceicola]|uniref:Heme exporter protein D n=1 Tax=Endozoicomonas euniceicola TaxID=1234143 RepID=A0ABY6GQM3_9GAMM|nr:heme exporter protein CcmD [Endozoicomonas euniceicola]UYM15053.1 heme exporter protein CcmD [Endozoicomonas euniceicola]